MTPTQVTLSSFGVMPPYDAASPLYGVNTSMSCLR